MEWQEKVWGRTRIEAESPFYQLHRLEVIEGGFCSIHYHEHRANRFRVLSGEIEVIEWFADITKAVRLTAGNIHDVPSLVVHQFRVLRSGEVIEEYWPDRLGQHSVETSDIIRITEGGMSR